MHRREFVKLGLASAVTTSVAGCTGQDPESENDGTRAPDTDQSNQDTPDSTVYNDHIEKADEAMTNAGDELQAESDKFSSAEFESGSVDVRTATIYDYLSTAEEHLKSAEPHATQSQKEYIELAGNWITLARDATEFLDIFAEGYSQANSGFTYIQSERYSDAVNQLETAETTLTDANDQLTLSKNSLSNIDRSKMEDLDAVSYTKVEDGINQLEELMPVIIELTSGMKDLSKGLVDYMDGSEAFDAENYSEAERKFRDAAEDFTVSHSTFKEQEDTAPDNMKTTFIELTCYSGALRDASDHLANAVEAIQNGNRTRANEEARKAEEATNRCDFS